MNGEGDGTAKARLLKAVLGADGYAIAPDDEAWFVLGGREREKTALKQTLSLRLAEHRKAGEELNARQVQQALVALEAIGISGA